MAITITTAQAPARISTILQAGLMPFLHGSPGIGKSAIVKKLADDFNLFLIDFRLAQCDPTDLLGFPVVDKETGRAYYAPMETFPLEGDPIPDGYDGWLIFFDEANAADRGTQKATYKTFYDRMVGNRKIHSKVAMVAAGNLSTDNAIVEEMSTALQSRMVHFEVKLDHEAFIEFALAAGFHHYIIDFLRFKPELIYSFKPDHTDKTYACPRTWEMTDKILKVTGPNDPNLMELLSGTLSEGVAREFCGFIQIYADLPTNDQIVNAPATTPIPNQPGTIYALTGSVANNAKLTTIGKSIIYINRMAKEFQVLCMRAIIARGSTFSTHPDVLKWKTDNALELF